MLRLMARWVVDGMNVIGTTPDAWWRDRDRAVRDLVDRLATFAQTTGEDVTAVFDHRPREMEPGLHGPVEVAFAARVGRDAADHEIAARVASHPDPRSLTVVTSDRDLAARVRDVGASVISAGAFLRRLRGSGERRPGSPQSG